MTIPLMGPHSVTVPGAVDMWATLLQQHGRKGIDAALQPAIRVAEEGYAVAPRVRMGLGAEPRKIAQGHKYQRIFSY